MTTPTTTATRTPWDLATPRNSSARKFLAAAIDGGWEVNADRVVDGLHVYVEITAVWPGEVPEGRWSKVTGSFDPKTGAFWWPVMILLKSRGREVSRGRGAKITEVIYALANAGPKWLAEQTEKQEKSAAEREAAEVIRRAALAEAAKIDSVVELVGRTKRERNSAAMDLRRSLESVIYRASEAIASLDQGHVPRPLGGMLGQTAAEAERLAGRVHELVEMTAQLEFLFGPADKSMVWEQWLDYRERLAKEEETKDD